MAPPSLTELANRYQSDKGTLFGESHAYTEVYERLFAPRRLERLRLLEIGLRHNPYYEKRDRLSSPSLQMWLDYFPHAEICGLDIDDFTGIRHDRLRIFRGDQGNPGVLSRLVDQVTPLDVVIDDGSHASYHQQMSFRYLFPHLQTSGIYVIEDLHWQPEPMESMLPAVPKTRDLFLSPAMLGLCEVSFHCEEKLCVVRRKPPIEQTAVR